MYIYNVTVNVENGIHDEWLGWMKEIHIGDVLGTNLFSGARLTEVMVEGDAGRTYSVQYEVDDMESLQLYFQMYAPKLQQELKDKFADKALAFRTILRVEEDFTIK